MLNNGMGSGGWGGMCGVHSPSHLASNVKVTLFGGTTLHP